MSSPRVALVHDWLTGMRGGEKVLEALAELYPEAPIFTLFHFPGSVSSALESHEIRTSFLQRAPGLRRWYRHYLPLFPAAVEDLDLSGFDLILSTSHCVAKGIIPPPGSRHVCYCHTPMRYAWDQERAYFPKRRGIIARLRGLELSRLRAWDVASSQRVDTFVANSKFVAERIQRYYRRGAEVVAPPVAVDVFKPDGGRPDGVRPDDGSSSLRHEAVRETPRDDREETGESRTGQEIALAVSALAPYKRLDQAIRVCERKGIQLKIVGTGPEEASLRRLAGPKTHFLGRVTEEELRALYREASFLLQPGVEDFGITPVEALACGTPVIAQGRGGVLDIVDDGVHGVLYEGADGQDDAQGLAAAIDKARGIRFNILNLRRRAETFSTMSFQQRMRTLLDGPLSVEQPAVGRPSIDPPVPSREIAL